MSQDFAVDLVNFMPPTTTLTVRPGVEYIMTIEGQVRGMFSYLTGASVNYGANWYNTNVAYGANKSLLIKTTYPRGGSRLVKIDPIGAKSNYVGTMENVEYDDDCVLYKHTMFFASGSAASAMYLYDEAKGLAKFALQIGNDGSKEIGDMTSLVFYKKYLFMAAKSGLNVYFIEAQYADILNDKNSAFWKFIENIFSPHFGDTFSLDGVVQLGGSILKMFQLSRSGADTLNSFLTIVTDMGEVVVFDGDDPTDQTGEKWKVLGKFKIPPPINKNCFVDMEGDYIVATQNGLVSLRRVIFGHTTEVTQSLERRIASLFGQYMFTMPAFSQFAGLYYLSKSRLLIFNVPYALPMPFNKVITSFQFFEKQVLDFPCSTINSEAKKAYIPDDMLSRITSFVTDFCVRNYINYSIIIEFNGNYQGSFIKLTTTSQLTTPELDNTQPCTITVNFSVKEGVDKTEISFFDKPLVYKVANLDDPNRTAVLDTTNDPCWNYDMFESSDNTVRYWLTENNTVTNIMTSTSQFFTSTSFRGIYRYNHFPVGYNRDACFGIEISHFYDNGSLSNIRWADIATRDYKENFWSPNSEGSTYVPCRTTLRVGNRYYDDCTDWHMVVITSIISLARKGKLPAWDSILPNSGIKWSWNAPINIDGSEVVANDITFTARIYDGQEIDGVYSKHGRYKLEITEEISTTGQGWHKDTKVYGFDIDDRGYAYIGYVYIGDTASTQTEYPTAAITDEDITAAFIKIESTNQNITFRGFDGQPTSEGDNDFATYTWLPEVLNILGSAPDFNQFKWYFANCKFELINDLETSPQSLNNTDLSLVPFFDNIDIVTNYRSTQYVFDSHFGTWSSFQDVNMAHGIEHDNDFYFVSPLDVVYSPEEASKHVIANSRLCKFNQAQLGDNIKDNYELSPINVSYKTVPTFDLGKPTKKIFKRLKMFGNPSVFWQPPRIGIVGSPIQITPYSDFKEGVKSGFVHVFDGQSVSSRLLAKHFKSRALRSLDLNERKRFWELYLEANDMISFVEIPMIAQIGTRFGLRVDMALTEAYMNLFGFEIFYEETKQIL
jgi:hypothetical protein